MQRVVVFVLLMIISVNSICLAQSGQNSNVFNVDTAHASPYNIYGAKYPRIEADARVTFRFKAPYAQKVQVSIANTPFDMVKGPDGVWSYTSEPQEKGYHNYWMIVDSTIVVDPATNAFIGYGHMCNGFEIPDPAGGFYELKDVPHGNVIIKNYFSETINSWRHIFVYTPPGYEANMSTRYPVLYLQHGGGEDERVWIEMGRTNLILDNLIAEGKVKPFIVVMETSAARKPGEPLPQMRPPDLPIPGQPRPRMNFSFDTFKEVMINDLIPFIDKNFRTLTDAANRAMAGLSMGGMVTTSVTFSNMDKFAYIGCFSGGPRVTANDTLKNIYNGVFADPTTFNKKIKLLFISNGTIEGNSPITASEILKKAGINNIVVYQSPGTAHEWLTWRRSLKQFAGLLFK